RRERVEHPRERSSVAALAEGKELLLAGRCGHGCRECTRRGGRFPGFSGIQALATGGPDSRPRSAGSPPASIRPREPHAYGLSPASARAASTFNVLIVQP